MILDNIQLARYDKPTVIQSYTIPAVVQGHDVVAVAQTGKTFKDNTTYLRSSLIHAQAPAKQQRT